DQNTGLIVMTHREDHSKAYGSGAYEPSFSTNMGASWDSKLVIFAHHTDRYPNGVIFNPAGNTNPKLATVIVCGPQTNGTNWVATEFGGIGIDSSRMSDSLFTNGTNGYTQNNGNLSFMSSSDDSTIHVMGEGFTM